MKKIIFCYIVFLTVIYTNVLCHAGTILVNDNVTDVESIAVDSRTLVPIRGSPVSKLQFTSSAIASDIVLRGIYNLPL